jgi:hypothetical protein
MSFLPPHLDRLGVLATCELRHLKHGNRVRVSGNVLYTLGRRNRQASDCHVPQVYEYLRAHWCTGVDCGRQNPERAEYFLETVIAVCSLTKSGHQTKSVGVLLQWKSNPLS